eukprot:scpid99570/ scgid17028/ Zinc finger SWIM domain-containing protein 7; SWIM domain-containing and Srs2-interacting protein 1 homolog; SWIM-type zinc finger domain-containing protein 7
MEAEHVRLNLQQRVGLELLELVHLFAKRPGKCTALSRSSSPRSLEDCLLMLYDVYGNVLLSALNIMERGLVSCARSPSGGSVYSVRGSTQQEYRVLLAAAGCGDVEAEHDHGDHCSCFFYSHRVMPRAESVACKHVLAARLAQGFNRLTVFEVDERDIRLMVSDMG